jgi:NAD(P)H-dependent FMN reductase
MAKPVLQIIIASTRPGRVGPAIARWFYDRAVQEGSFDVELVDLASFALPVFDEPSHPAFGQYEHEHTRRWSESVARADAFVFVMPEYNHSFNAALKNALDYLYGEWRYKAVGLFSYGGAAMGIRAVQAIQPVLVHLKMVHTSDVTASLAVTPVVDGVFEGNEILEQSARAMLFELAKVTPSLQSFRA